VGLAKFRQTIAEFKQFQVGQDRCSVVAGPELRATLEKALAQLPNGKLPVTKEFGELLKHRWRARRCCASGPAIWTSRQRIFGGFRWRARPRRCLAELGGLLKTPDKDVDLLAGGPARRTAR